MTFFSILVHLVEFHKGTPAKESPNVQIAP
jgi:hypothetical protein